MRFAIDGTWKRTGAVVVAGSPLKIFRLTAPGARIAEQIEQGADVASSTLTDRLLDAGAIHPEYRPDATSVFTVDDVTVITPQLGGVASTDGRMVVDDGSRPPIDGAAIRLDSNGGPAAARNAGRPLATTALVAFVDADVDLLADVGIGCWLTQLLPHFDDPSVALVAPRVAGEPGSQLDLGIEPGRVRAGTRIGYVPAAAIVVRADALDEVGGFDPALRFGEDVDLVWRLDQAGWRCRYEPASTVWHEPRSNWPDRLRQHAGYGSAAAPLALRHPDALAPMHTNQWAVGSWLSALGGHRSLPPSRLLRASRRLSTSCPVSPRHGRSEWHSTATLKGSETSVLRSDVCGGRRSRSLRSFRSGCGSSHLVHLRWTSGRRRPMSPTGGECGQEWSDTARGVP